MEILKKFKEHLLTELARHFRTFGNYDEDEEDYCLYFPEDDSTYYMVSYIFQEKELIDFFRGEFLELSNNEAVSLAFNVLPNHVLIGSLTKILKDK